MAEVQEQASVIVAEPTPQVAEGSSNVDVDLESHEIKLCNLVEDCTEEDKQRYSAKVYGALSVMLCTTAALVYRITALDQSWLLDHFWILILVEIITLNSTYILFVNQEYSRNFIDTCLIFVTQNLAVTILLGSFICWVRSPDTFTTTWADSLPYIVGLTMSTIAFMSVYSMASKTVRRFRPYILATLFLAFAWTLSWINGEALGNHLENRHWFTMLPVSLAMVFYIIRNVRKMTNAEHRYYKFRTNEATLAATVAYTDIFEPIHHLCGLYRKAESA